MTRPRALVAKLVDGVNRGPGRPPVWIQPGVTIVINQQVRPHHSMGPLIDVAAAPSDSGTDGDYESKR